MLRAYEWVSENNWAVYGHVYTYIMMTYTHEMSDLHEA